MAVVVRMFSYTGLMTVPVASGSKRFSSDSVGVLKHPYAAREAVTANDTAQSTTTALTPEGTECLFIQVAQNGAVHVELNPPNRAVNADTSSPIMSGDNILCVGKNWTVSLLEAELPA